MKNNLSGDCFSITTEMKPNKSGATVMILVDLSGIGNSINNR